MTESAPGNGGPSRATALTLCILAIVIGASLRVAAMRGDLSFDEIWSIAWARWVGSPIGIFTAIHVDNNHYLNTLTMWLLAPLDWHAVWRIPAVIASVVTIGLAGLYGARHSRAAAICCALLHAFSFLLIQYGSEARGYALAACLVVAAMIVVEQAGEATPPRLLLFSAIVGIGILAHLTVLLFALPASALLVARAIRLRPSGASMITRLAALGAVPLAVTVSLWWLDLRFLHIAGGPESSVATAMTQLAGLVFGIWRGPYLGVASLGACALFALLAIPKVRAGQGPLLLIAASTLLLSLALVPGNMAYPRYFLVPFELLMLSLGRSLGVLLARPYQHIGAICLAVVAAANLPAVIDLATIGRGQYRAALSSIAARSQGEVVLVGSDHDLRNGQTFDFYASKIHEGRRLKYQPQALAAGPAVDWLIFHDTSLDAPAPPDLIEVRGTRYTLDHSERHAGMSGFTWHLYRRSTAAPNHPR
ncbi:MAG: hypothetical protein NDJ92_17845 [Thermoanaerobaculia bacterium]|nr:hypothetical protein [Thermoanaerobaculia bacterium]